MYNPSFDYSGGGLEQMIVGGSSPGSSSNPTTSPGIAQYLPGFLMSDTGTPTAANNPRAWSMPGSPSPTKSVRGQLFSTSVSTSPKSLLSPIQAPATQPVTPNFARHYHRQTSEKHSGPPVHGLFEYTSTPKFPVKNSMSNTSALNVSSLSHPAARNVSMSAEELLNPHVSKCIGNDFKFPSSPAQLDPFYTQREGLKSDEELDHCWVTVFGFPAAASSYILQQFYHYGNITDYKMSPSGNWMHLHYQTQLQAKVALSKNGKIFNGSVMIGVAPCIDKAVMNQCRNTSRTTTQSQRQTDTSLLNASLPVNNNTPINVAFKFAADEHAVIPTGTVPEKNGGLMSKALEYLFGW